MGGEIRVAVVGVGNCCSALVQGVSHYSQRKGDKSKSFLFHPQIGGYQPSQIKFAAAFDVDERKVGRDISKAIFSEPNNFPNIHTPPPLGVVVEGGPTLNGVGGVPEGVVKVSKKRPVDVAARLKETGAEIMVNLTPTGASKASSFYAEQALKAGCGFINATPASIATDRTLAQRFKRAGLPVVGDDLMSQIGGTVLHKSILEFLERRGVRVAKSYQLDVGGGSETLNTTEYSRRALKRRIKTEAVKSALPYEAEIVTGTTDYVPFLGNGRVSYYWFSGSHFLNSPLEIDLYLRTFDAPNGAAILIDIIRGMKLARDEGLKGSIPELCAYGFKNPPERRGVEEAQRLFEEFIQKKPRN